MAGITQIKKELHSTFVERLEEQFEPNVLEKLLRGFESDRLPVIRINTLKADLQAIMSYLRERSVQFERVPFLSNALIIKNKKEKYFEDLDIYQQGHIYFQGISSQLPVLFLDPKPGEKILDVSSAPGSKTTQIGINMKNQGEILANEIDEIRHERLKYNLDKQGITVAQTRLGDGVALGHEYPETFDRVLLDAPCSAEGRIDMKKFRTYKFWSEKNIKKNAQLQKRLFISAYKALKPGGSLMYSTCTLAPEENETILDWAIKKFDDLEIQKLKLDFKHLLPTLSKFQEREFDKKVHYGLKASSSNISEGFFIALFKKKS